MTKRRLISLLPQINQTDDLKGFFGATVDQAFQPGTADAISGYIGRPVSSIDAANFYVKEPSASRTFYQLEPGMISYDALDHTQINYELNYPDLVAYLQVNGAITTDHQRLFETDYYAWAPPINIDMLVNFHNYYWFGDATQHAGFAYAWNPTDKSGHVTLSNNNLSAVATNIDSTVSAVRSVIIPNGTWYVEFSIDSGSTVQHCGLANNVDAITGSPGEQADLYNAVIYKSTGQVFNDSGTLARTLSGYHPGEIIGMAWNSTTKKLWFRRDGLGWNDGLDDPTNNFGGIDITALLANGAAQLLWAGTGPDCQVTVNFGDSAFVHPVPNGFSGPTTKLASATLPILTLRVPVSLYTGDGTTTSFALPPAIAAIIAADETPAAYVNNQAVSFSVQGANLVLAVAPINGSTVLICRTNDFATAIDAMSAVNVHDLNTQGVIHLSSGMRIKIIDAMHISNAWDSESWDIADWDAGNEAEYFVDGIGQALRLTPYSSIVRGLGAQYVTIDRSSRDNNQWSLHNSWVHVNSFAWSGQAFPQRQATRPIIEFVRDLVLYPGQIWFDQNLQTEQTVDPLFMLYDLQQHALDDDAYYPHSTFAGNRLFGFAAGNGPIDVTLGRALRYDAFGYIEFNNDSETIEYNYQLSTVNPVNTPITGLVCYGCNDGTHTTFNSFWLPAAQSTAQTLSADGFYSIPDNLQANPDYAEVAVISRSKWLDHFQSILNNQVGATQDASGASNYRDSARDLSLGSGILQHQAPMLKTMLLAASSAFDLPRAIRFAELEYSRFRNKFTRKLVDLRNRGVLQDDAAPSLWVSTALAALKIGPTDRSPFALSSMGGGQYFIPPTPTGLGLLPAATPGFMLDTTYGVPFTMMLGHDGSLLPSFGDWRDPIMLALETQLFANLPAGPLVEARPDFDIQRWIGSRYYSPENGYSRAEVATVLAPMFELWAQINRFDYHSHPVYDANDPFTWNFRDLLDVGGQPLPGNWRAIYRWYFDTDAPHLRPWEMLGFISRPAWWVATYGDVPYTRTNTALWADLTAGRIVAGPRMGIDPRYARANLLDRLPVADDGSLLDPVQAGIITTTVIFELGSRPWQAGDHGPAENLWWISSASRFALAQASFLLKPARCVEQSWDVERIGFVADQWVLLDSHQRPRNVLQYVHGEINPATPTQPTVVTGLSQWLADYLLSTGQSSASLGTAIRGLNVALMHQMAGFASKDDIQLVADGFGLLPAENVHLVLSQSPAVRSEVYSGVLIEWTGRSWRVIGFDGRAPYFTIIPGNPTGPKGLISLATASEPSIVPWRSNSYYPVQILVDYHGSVYQCLRSHTSGPTFETSFWTPRADLATAMIRAPRVITYLNGLDNTIKVPYGTEFTDYQSVADFLLGWERWLLSRGWTFNELDAQNQILNWSLSVREFLSWAQVQWPAGNFIAVSPGQRKLKFRAAQGTILNVEDNVTGFYGLIDRSGQPIGQREAAVGRLDDTITLTTTTKNMFLSRLEICHIEHVLILDNTTLFSDAIYLPLYNLRLPRLRLICTRASDWNGRLDAPGFIINGDRLLSSFEKAASDIRLMFDIELADVKVLRDYARHTIGMQKRNYLNDLLLSSTEQFELYQGMIQEKGTPGVFAKITRSHRASGNSTLRFLEEWGFRLGSFGAPDDPFLTFQLTQTDIRDDPQFISLIPQDHAPLDWIVLQTDDSRWFDQPSRPHTFFPTRNDYAPASLPTAGPVRLQDVGNTAFHITDVPDLYAADSNSLPTGSRIWVYDSEPLIQGNNWYVNAVSGDDLNAGTSAASAFASLQIAHDRANQGDIIHVASGTYTGAEGTSVLQISNSGTAAAPIVFQAMPGADPLIVGSSTAFAAVQINAVSYVTLRGFTIVGWNPSLNQSDAQAVSGADAQVALFNGSGIQIGYNPGDRPADHIIIEKCIVHDFPYNGILVNWADYVTVRDCTIYDNAWYSSAAGAGISILNSHSSDSLSVYKTFVQRNICYGNINKVLSVDGTVVNGCGISIIGNRNALTDGISYTGRTLVENNLCYNNGGDGILVIDSSTVDVIFNTCYLNQTGTNNPYGEIAAVNATDCNIFNNILYASPGMALTTTLGNLRVAYNNNIGYQTGSLGSIPGARSLTDPLFMRPPSDFTQPIAPIAFKLRVGSVAISAASPQFRTTTDLLGNQRDDDCDIGCFQADAQPPAIAGRHPFDVLGSFDTGAWPNSILTITTATEDDSVTTMRIVFQFAMTLSSNDIGNFLLIDGLTSSQPELQGVQVITAVNTDTNSVDLQVIGQKGVSFATAQASAPVVRVLRSLRFDTLAAVNPDYPFAIGDLIWLDHYLDERWAVMQWDGSQWLVARLQPRRPDTLAINETVIYQTGAQIVGNRLLLNKPVVDDVVVIDPLVGLISNVADREIDFRTEYDPARYNAGFGSVSADNWGPNEIGRVWWDISTVRFIDPFTDSLGQTSSRDLSELQYRIDQWAHIAPNTSVDVYEWIESAQNPLDYVATPTSLGSVYNPDAPAWVERVVYNPVLQRDVTLYYFWVKNLTTVPNLDFRTVSISRVALGIINPAAINSTWMSVISPSGLLLSGVTAFLDHHTTVMKIGLRGDPAQVGHHDQWALMRPEDSNSLPSNGCWDKLRDSLAGFAVVDAALVPVPDPALSLSRNTGIGPGQGMFIVNEQAIPSWQAGHVYYFGDLVNNGGSAYQCVVEGVSISNGPATTLLTISDGTAQWKYVGLLADSDHIAAWQPLHAYTLGVSIENIGKVYSCTRAGTSAGLRAGPSGVSNTTSDGTVLWQYYSSDTSRSGLLAARAAFIGSVNAIFRTTPINQTRSKALAAIQRSTPYASLYQNQPPYLAWAQIDASYPYEPPPINEWDAGFEVHTLSQRNDLLSRVEFSNAIASYATLAANYATPNLVPISAIPYISVLLDGFANLTPQWSIWRFDPAAAYQLLSTNSAAEPIALLIANADSVFSLKTAYEQSVTTVAQRDALTLHHLDRVLVTADTFGFWSIYQWLQPDPAVAGTFKLWRIQTYDTASPFIVETDWYDIPTMAANGYRVSNPPIITYPDIATRDRIEGPLPTNSFVKIINNGADFLWTAYLNDRWQTIAIGQGTVQLSSLFSDPTRIVHGLANPTVSTLLTPGAGSFRDINGVLYAITTDGNLTENGQRIPDGANTSLIAYADQKVYAQDATSKNWFIWNGTYFTASVAPSISPPSVLSLRDVNTRDGSWEMRILVQALRYSDLLSDAEINHVWFDMVNFAHVQQNEVDWAFKSSFMSIKGVAVPMDQTPIVIANQTNNVIDYVNEVKPYRVKVRETTIQYSPDNETVTVHATDFDQPLYTDANTLQVRALDPTNSADIVVLQTAPWADWYNNYALTNSPVRALHITMLFDRLSIDTNGNWDMENWDTGGWDFGEADIGAGYRILSTMPDADLSSLLGLGPKYDTITSTLLSTYDLVDDGGTFIPQSYDNLLNPSQPSQPGGYDLRAPYVAPNHPEERAPFGADDGLQITVTADPLAGAPPQIIKVFNVSTLTGPTVLLRYSVNLVAQSAYTVWVFCDGRRAVLQTDYTIDHLNRSATVNLIVNGLKVQRVVIHVFGLGANGPITEQHYLTYGVNPLQINTATPNGTVLAVVNGIPLQASDVAVHGNTVVLVTPPATGSDVALAVLPAGINGLCQLQQQSITYSGTNTWTLSYPDHATFPQHSSTIVEVNALRLTPPMTFYGTMQVGKPWVYLPIMPIDTTTVTVYVDSVAYTQSIPICLTSDTTSTYPFHLVLPGAAPTSTVAGQFVFYDNMLVALDANFISNNVVIVLQLAGTTPDYTVVNDVLTINSSLTTGDQIVVSTFSNAAQMGIQTVSYPVGTTAQMMLPNIAAASYAHVTMDGLTLAPEDEYTLDIAAVSNPDIYFTAPKLAVFNPTAGYLVATMFTGSPARETMHWRYTSRTPAFIRMTPATGIGNLGWDNSPLDAQAFDNTQLTGIPTNGLGDPTPQFSIDNSFEAIRLSPYMAGTLINDLGIADSSLSIALFIQPISVKLQETNPLPLPDTVHNTPGAIWIEDERIEYFGYERVADVVTLSLLRRATRGTSMGAKRLVMTATGDGSSHDYTFTAPGVVDVSIDGIMQAATTYAVNGRTVTLTVANASYAVIGMTIAASHRAGVPVWNGKQVFPQDVPIGPIVGNRELQPMHTIIG